jgi:NAD+ synthase
MSPLTQLTLDVDLVRRTIVEFIRDEVTKAGMRRALLGLSGGIDSALTCYLAVEALGADNVLGLLLPYQTSSPASERDAMLVIDALGIEYAKIPITPMVDAFQRSDPDMNARRLGNIMSRVRMVALYDRSVAYGGLVLGTSNRTETLLGYFTIYGDGAAALRPIAPLYKCQVRQLSQAVGVPKPIITKPPSADLWQDQTDDGELGFTYDQADEILHLHTDRRMPLEAIAQEGFSLELIRRVLARMAATRFKRVEPPAPELPPS